MSGQRAHFLAVILHADHRVWAVDVFHPNRPRVVCARKLAHRTLTEVEIVNGQAHAIGAPLADAESALHDLIDIAAEHGLDYVFPPEVKKEVQTLTAPDRPHAIADGETLRDLRMLPFVTIDNEDSRDLDQALYIDREPNSFHVYYALADASHYIPVTSALFAEALQRGASYYLPGWMIPMLPRALSEGLVSLNPHVDRRALIFDMQVDEQGQSLSTRVYQALIHSHDKLSYRGVQAYLDAPGSHPMRHKAYAQSLQRMREFGIARMQHAAERNVVRHRRRSTTVELTQGNSFVVYATLRNDVERYNEQLSLLCNTEGARLLQAREQHSDTQAIYRVHPAPDESRLQGFQTFAERLADAHQKPARTWCWQRTAGQSLAEYLDQLSSHPNDARIVKAIHRQAILTNVRSTYSEQPGRHYGVGVDVYARFSSPMREVVGVFLHKELLETQEASRNAHETNIERDEALRVQIIEAANRSRSIQKKITRQANQLALMQRFTREIDLPLDARDWHLGTLMGLTRSKIHITLDASNIDLKLYHRDVGQFLGHVVYSSKDEVRLHTETKRLLARIGSPVAVRVSHFDPQRDRWIFEPKFTQVD